MPRKSERLQSRSARRDAHVRHRRSAAGHPTASARSSARAGRAGAHARGRGSALRPRLSGEYFRFRREAGLRRPRESRPLGPRGAAAGMASDKRLVLKPWIRGLILESETLSSPQAGQLLEVQQDAESDAPGPSSAPDTSGVGASLLVSDGIHSVRCLVTPEALQASDWEEKEFGFRGTEGRLLLLQDCEVRVHVFESGMSAEFYLQVNRFSLLPSTQCREWVLNCNQDPEVRRKLYDCLEEHLSESTTPSAGFSLTQLLNEVEEDQEQGRALLRLAESCLMPSGCSTKPSLTRWASLRLSTAGEAVYTVPSVRLHIYEHDQQILSALDSEQNAHGTPPLPGHVLTEESGASVSLLPALPRAAPGPEESSSQPRPVTCSTPGPLPPSSPPPSHVTNSSLLSHTPSLSPLSHIVNPQLARVTRPQKTSLRFKELGLPPKTSPRSASPGTSQGASEPSTEWNPPKRHRDGSAFQYVYGPPCASLCAQVQATRLPSRFLSWALFFLMESQVETEQTKV
ncbi:adrenocortical dysplasia protein homolog isoform X3 [Sorex araneus]|uniref:adrenocortical dysplasia protein homolog isoform X3 n=1 Tax=Sorex araneus TaxID=42254 RepID=UPI00243338F3|nr:adrenocortical dysplasia protein homolog isoform X3 [Sorex araneus]